MLFDFDHLLVLLGFLLLLLLFKTVLAVIQHLAHRRNSLRCDLDQIQTSIFSSAHGHLNGHNALLLAVCTDQTDLTVTDLTVDLQFLRLSSGSDNECTSKQNPFCCNIWHRKRGRPFSGQPRKNSLKATVHS